MKYLNFLLILTLLSCQKETVTKSTSGQWRTFKRTVNDDFQVYGYGQIMDSTKLFLDWCDHDGSGDANILDVLQVSSTRGLTSDYIDWSCLDTNFEFSSQYGITYNCDIFVDTLYFSPPIDGFLKKWVASGVEQTNVLHLIGTDDKGDNYEIKYYNLWQP